jgi:hypothetical protein
MCGGSMMGEIFFMCWKKDIKKIAYFCTSYFPILKLQEIFKVGFLFNLFL